MKKKVGFTFKIRGIDGGFIVILENEHGLRFEEKHCKSYSAISKLITKWIQEISGK